MKKVIFVLSLLTVTISQAAVTYNQNTNTPENQSEALKRIKVDEWIRDARGNSYHIYGWVDVSIGFDGISISDYDIRLEGPGVNLHFQGKVARTQRGDGSIGNTIGGTLINENGEVIEMSEEIKNLIYQTNEIIIRNN